VSGAGGRRWILPAVVAISLAVLVLLGRVQHDHSTPVMVGSRMPAYAAPTLKGDTVHLRRLKGNVVLVNVWASWCVPCREEMPSLERLYQALHPQGLDVVAVAVDDAPLEGGVSANVVDFVEHYDLTFPVLVDPTGGAEQTFSVVGLPTTLLVDRSGHIVDKLMGGRIWDHGPLADRVRELLGE
jgi:cytochrome c biogenesis protein CcmG, thiol:disulfide interchange protein DsbE